MQRLVIVSNRLPVSVERGPEGFDFRPSIGGLATSLSTLREEREMVWVGWPGIELEKEAERQDIRTRLRQESGCVPLFIPPELFERFYDGFSNSTIWPLFHYFPQHAHFDQKTWKAYQKVNKLFLEKLLEVVQSEDWIWVHDYHLMLLPAMIREALPQAVVGFFLHIPFPSYELFRMIPWREELLYGLLGADLIGFHSFGYARHFLSSLLRVLGLEQEFGQVIHEGRPVKVDTFPLGVDVERFSQATQVPEVITELEDLRRNTAGRKVVLSVDRLDFTKGILERLRAFEGFLDQYPTWRGQVSLISLLVPSRTKVAQYRKMKRQVDELVGRINGRFGTPGWTPIWYLYRSLPFEKLVPLYQLADVALVTPIRDGMNLVAKEYLASHPDGRGVLVLSETAGSAEELGEALVVNPMDQQAIIQAMHAALTMPLQEQRDRNQPMLLRLRRYDTARWAEDFLEQMEQAKEERTRHAPTRLWSKQWERLVQDFRTSERRLLLLDYDGTLIPFVAIPEEARPDEDLLRTLTTLSQQENTTVVIISGRGVDILEDWLADTGVQLVAEHGARMRIAEQGQWKLMGGEGSHEWMEQLRPVFEVFVDRTPGSRLETKGAALVWHYRAADPGLGSLRAKELADTLEGYVANTPLHILQGSKTVEVKQSSVSKGKATQAWIERLPSCDFLLAVGDDVTDEDMFQVLPSNAWSIKVGFAKHSNARFYLGNPFEVRRLLAALADESRL